MQDSSDFEISSFSAMTCRSAVNPRNAIPVYTH
jgi:hypothetical protein